MANCEDGASNLGNHLSQWSAILSKSGFLVTPMVASESEGQENAHFHRFYWTAQLDEIQYRHRLEVLEEFRLGGAFQWERSSELTWVQRTPASQ
jgi:hypothetical protein